MMSFLICVFSYFKPCFFRLLSGLCNFTFLKSIFLDLWCPPTRTVWSVSISSAASLPHPIYRSLLAFYGAHPFIYHSTVLYVSLSTAATPFPPSSYLLEPLVFMVLTRASYCTLVLSVSLSSAAYPPPHHPIFYSPLSFMVPTPTSNLVLSVFLSSAADPPPPYHPIYRSLLPFMVPTHSSTFVCIVEKYILFSVRE